MSDDPLPPKQERSEEAMYRIYDSIWQNIAREDGNVSNRIQWAIGLTAGQFTAIAFLVSQIIDKPQTSTQWSVAISVTICAVSVLGMYFCYRTHLGVDAAHQQMEMLRRYYIRHEKRFNKMMLPRPYGDGNNRAGRKSSHVYPMALLIFWSLIFVASLGSTIWTVSLVAQAQGRALESRPSGTASMSSTRRILQTTTDDLHDTVTTPLR